MRHLSSWENHSTVREKILHLPSSPLCSSLNIDGLAKSLALFLSSGFLWNLSLPFHPLWLLAWYKFQESMWATQLSSSRHSGIWFLLVTSSLLTELLVLIMTSENPAMIRFKFSPPWSSQRYSCTFSYPHYQACLFTGLLEP